MGLRKGMMIMKRFNTTGSCLPDIHYMVDLNHKLKQIKDLVDRGSYFTINKSRQFGKTTILKAMKRYLNNDYIILSASFENAGDVFKHEKTFCQYFYRLLYTLICNESRIPDEVIHLCQKNITEANFYDFIELSDFISILCDNRKVILMIDEVDQAGNYEVFIKFLGVLRNKYLNRDEFSTFYSVILAGVHDVKNMKLKIRNEAEHQYNSPWNIAEDFCVDMSFSANEIATMLIDYENDHHTNMDIDQISNIIYDYTSGYPFLVSLICKVIDEQLNKDFTVYGIKKAVKIITSKSNTLFQDMIKNVQKYEDLSKLIQSILFNGKEYSYHPDSYIINIGIMFGFLKNNQGKVCISNRIFEIYLYDYFIISEEINKTIYEYSRDNRSQFFVDQSLDMKKIIIKFSEYFNDIYNVNDIKFVEEYGRKIFLMYLKPIINGVGNYYVEARTRDNTRTDIIVDYLGKQYIIELKIWHGNSYNERGEQQLVEYLDLYHENHGYMISFNFNKNKTPGIKEIQINDKTIFEAII